MKTNLLVISGILALSPIANAALITGINFSNFYVNGVNSINPTTGELVQVIPALFSDLDPDNPQGCPAEPSGAFRFDGQFGSSNPPLSSGLNVPADGNLQSNNPVPRDVPLPFGLSFNAAILPTTCSNPTIVANGFQYVAAIAIQPISFVVTSTPENFDKAGEDWAISFAAGIAFNQGAAGSIVVEFSADGTNYTSIGTANILSTDSAYSFTVPDSLDERLGTAYFRLTFTQFAGNSATMAIDNIAVSGTISDFVGGECTAPEAVDIEVAQGAGPNEVDVILAFDSIDGVTYDVLGGGTVDGLSKVGEVVGNGSTVTFEDTIDSRDRFFYQIVCPGE